MVKSVSHFVERREILFSLASFDGEFIEERGCGWLGVQQVWVRLEYVLSPPSLVNVTTQPTVYTTSSVCCIYYRHNVDY